MISSNPISAPLRLDPWTMAAPGAMKQMCFFMDFNRIWPLKNGENGEKIEPVNGEWMIIISKYFPW